MDYNGQAPLSLGFPRREYWSGLPFPSLGIFPTQGLNLCLLCLQYWQVDSLPLSHQGSYFHYCVVFHYECFFNLFIPFHRHLHCFQSRYRINLKDHYMNEKRWLSKGSDLAKVIEKLVEKDFKRLY